MLQIEIQMLGNKAREVADTFKRYKGYRPTITPTEYIDTTPIRYESRDIKRKDTEFLLGIMVGMGYKPRMEWVSYKTYTVTRIA